MSTGVAETSPAEGFCLCLEISSQSITN